MINNILFDLDGTLTDSGIGITNSVAYALNKFGMSIPDRKILYKFIGPPLRNSFSEYYGFDREKSELAVKYYREYFTDIGIFENEIYPGIRELLEELYEEGKNIILATSKPEEFAIRILKHFDICKYFKSVCGSSMDAALTSKTDIIAYAIRENNINPNKCIMIGDREYDIIGAKNNYIKSVGVLYGYGSLDEFSKAGADYIIDTVENLKNFLIKEI